jgi:hypothetical protein
VRRGFSIYVDPNFKPDYFYPLLKVLCVLYDRVIVWSPMRDHLDKHGFSSSDFLAACDPSRARPVITPAGRPAWFDPNTRRGHPDEEARIIDAAFERRVGESARAQGSVVPAEYQDGYQLTDQIFAGSPQAAEWAKGIAGKILPDLSAAWRARLATVADERRRTLEWAVVNSYVQDGIALRRLGANAPLVRLEQADGYSLLAEPPPPIATGSSNDLPPARQRPAAFPDLPPEVAPEDVVRFCEDAWSLATESWTEVLKYRRHGAAVRRWLRANMTRQQRPIGLTISQTAFAQASTLRDHANRVVTLGSVATLWPLVNRASTWSETSLIVGGVLALARFYVPLGNLVARMIGGPRRFLVDTRFYATAEHTTTLPVDSQTPIRRREGVTHDVFISYSFEDRDFVTQAVGALESKRVRCWMAPRDLAPTASFPAQIMAALPRCRFLVVFISRSSNQSDHVKNEVTQANNHGIPRIPFLLDGSKLAAELEYGLSYPGRENLAGLPPAEAVERVVRVVLDRISGR